MRNVPKAWHEMSIPQGFTAIIPVIIPPSNNRVKTGRDLTLFTEIPLTGAL